MARIRTIKPTFFRSLTVTELPKPTRLTWIGLWTYVDDAGRGVDDARLVKAELWPLDDDYPAKKVEKDLELLEANGSIRRYVVDGRRYFVIVEWHHQKIDRPTPSLLPPPPDRILAESSPNPRRSLPDASHQEEEQGIGTGNREQGTGIQPSAGLAVCDPPTPTPSRPPQAVAEVFEAWLTSTGRSNRTILDAKRRRLIDRALDAYPLADVLDAVRGWRHSPHHRGENDSRTVYNDLELLLRDAAHIEKFRDLERQAPSTNGGPRITPGEQAIANVFAQLPRGAA